MIAEHLFYDYPNLLSAENKFYSKKKVYSVTDSLFNFIVQLSFLKVCTYNFSHESVKLYNKVKSYKDIKEIQYGKETKYIKEIIELLGEYRIEDNAILEFETLHGRILKYFISSEEKHQGEIIEKCKQEIKRCKENLLTAPPIHILKFIKSQCLDSEYEKLKRNREDFLIGDSTLVLWKESKEEFFK